MVVSNGKSIHFMHHHKREVWISQMAIEWNINRLSIPGFP